MVSVFHHQCLRGRPSVTYLLIHQQALGRYTTATHRLDNWQQCCPFRANAAASCRFGILPSSRTCHTFDIKGRNKSPNRSSTIHHVSAIFTFIHIFGQNPIQITRIIKPTQYNSYPLVNEHNFGKAPCSEAKSTISMAIFNRELQ